MEITKFKKLKNSQYEVVIDNTPYKLYDDIILKYNLLTNKSIDLKLLNQILDDNTEYDAYYQSLKYINIKMRTKKEINDYLIKKGYDKKQIDKTINKLDNNNLFNNKIYLTSYINDQINLTNNGPYKILNNLIKLGFNEEEINTYLDFDLDIWQTKINKYIDKKTKLNHKFSNNELKRKLNNDLSNLGYQHNLINESLSSINFDDTESFNKSADKIYDKLKKKYQEPKLSYYFRSKMYNLGYDNELINAYLNKK